MKLNVGWMASIIVAILIVVAVGIPVISSAVEDNLNEKFVNSSNRYSDIVTKDVSGSLSNGSFIVNGKEIDVTSERMVIFSDGGYMNMLNGATCNITTESQTVGYVNGFDYVIDAETRTVSISNITYSNSTSTPTELGWTYDNVCFFANSTGSYSDRWIVTDATYYVNDVADIYSIFYKDNTLSLFKGEDRITGTGTLTVDLTKISGVEDAYSFIQGANDGDLTYNNGTTDYYGGYIIVPISILSEKDGLSVVSTIVSVLPILMVIGLLIAIVRYRA